MSVTLEMIRGAKERMVGAIYHSPCPYSLSLSKLCGAEVYCKLDHLQMTGSFKERGARNKLLQLSAQRKNTGVIAASAGNHALGLAYHGGLLRVPVTVVMPKWAPIVKVSNCRGFGATVILHGESFDEARAEAERLAAERGLTFVPAFDDVEVIAGQGTMGLEILEDVPGVEAVVVPVGGGGLIAGVGTAIKALRPQVKVIGVESLHAPTLKRSLEAGRVIRVATQPSLADGLNVAECGHECFAIAQRVVDEVALVDETQIAKAVLRLLELEKMVVEGAGAVGLAAMMHREALGLRGLEGKKIVLVLCGGNIDMTLVARIIDRGMAADGRLARITVHIPDRPGTLAKVLAVIGETGGSIKEVTHDRHFGPADVALARVSLVVETRDAGHVAEIHAALKAAGMMFEG